MHLEQVEDLNTELIVEVSIAGVCHVVDKYEAVFLSLHTVGDERDRVIKNEEHPGS